MFQKILILSKFNNKLIILEKIVENIVIKTIINKSTILYNFKICCIGIDACNKNLYFFLKNKKTKDIHKITLPQTPTIVKYLLS